MARQVLTAEVHGAQELVQSLQALEPEIRRSAVRDCLRVAGAVLKTGMAQRAPRAEVHRVVRKGRNYPARLADSIITRVQVGAKEASVTVTFAKSAFWGRFNELGTKHMAPQPFMVPTAEQDGANAVDALEAELDARLDTIVSRVASSQAAATQAKAT